MKVVKEKVKNVSVQITDIINNNLIEVVSDIKNKLNCEVDNLNCYIQTNFDTQQVMMKLMMALMTKALMKVISMIS